MKSTVEHQYTSAGMTKLKRLAMSSTGEDLEQLELSHFADGETA